MQTQPQDASPPMRGVGAMTAGALAAAVGATLCCTVPLILIATGTGAAWLSTLEALQPWRPLFVVAAVGALYWAHTRLDRVRSAYAVADTFGVAAANDAVAVSGRVCTRRDVRRTRLWVWAATVVVFALLVSPRVAAWLLGVA